MGGQRGVSLVELVLMLSLAGAVLAFTLPVLTYFESQLRQQYAKQEAINNTVKSLRLALNAHWQQSQCRTAPHIDLPQLLESYQLPLETESVLPGLSVNIQADLASPFFARLLNLSFDADSETHAKSLTGELNRNDYRATRKGSRVTVSTSITAIETSYERMTINKETGCFE